MRSIALDVFSEKFASSDAFPFEVFGQGLQVFLAAAARSSHKENTAHGIHLDLLQDKLERVFGAGNDELLQKILEKLIDLVFIEVLFNRLHVVELLHLVHLFLIQIFQIFVILL